MTQEEVRAATRIIDCLFSYSTITVSSLSISYSVLAAEEISQRPGAWSELKKVIYAGEHYFNSPYCFLS